MKKVYPNNFILRISLTMCFLIGLIASCFGVNAAAKESVTVRIPFSYEDKGGACENASILIEYEKGMPVPDSDTKTVSSGSTDYFTIEADEVGIYTYKIYQKNGGDSKVQYDDTVYEATVYVTKVEGSDKLEYTLTVVSVGSGAKPDKMEFVNNKTGDSGKDDPEPDPSTEATTEATTETPTEITTESTAEATTETLVETKSSSETKTGDDIALYTVLVIGFIALILSIGIVYLKRNKNGD